MANHYISLARGVEGTKNSDFTTGTATNATALFEFRVLDGVTPSRVEVKKALEAFEWFFDNGKQFTDAGFDVGG